MGRATGQRPDRSTNVDLMGPRFNGMRNRSTIRLDKVPLGRQQFDDLTQIKKCRLMRRRSVSLHFSVDPFYRHKKVNEIYFTSLFYKIYYGSEERSCPYSNLREIFVRGVRKYILLYLIF